MLEQQCAMNLQEHWEWSLSSGIGEISKKYLIKKESIYLIPSDIANSVGSFRFFETDEGILLRQRKCFPLLKFETERKIKMIPPLYKPLSFLS